MDESIFYVCLTGLDTSEDLAHGELRIHSPDRYIHPVALKEGSTVVFSSSTKFEITRVDRGSRSLLLSFIGKK